MLTSIWKKTVQKKSEERILYRYKFEFLFLYVCSHFICNEICNKICIDKCSSNIQCDSRIAISVKYIFFCELFFRFFSTSFQCHRCTNGSQIATMSANVRAKLQHANELKTSKIQNILFHWNFPSFINL